MHREGKQDLEIMTAKEMMVVTTIEAYDALEAEMKKRMDTLDDPNFSNITVKHGDYELKFSKPNIKNFN